MQLIGPPRRPEIDQYAIKFIIGVIALSLPLIEIWLARGITSISASFWHDPIREPWPRNVFVGFLFAIAALLLSYNGKSELEMWLTKIAALAAFLIAMFPCACDPGEREIIPYVHEASAGVMFAVLAAFCVIFMRRANAKGHRQARWRAFIYAICGLGMLSALVLFGTYLAQSRRDPLLLCAESVGLLSFGVSWLTASRVLPGITSAGERQRLVV